MSLFLLIIDNKEKTHKFPSHHGNDSFLSFLFKDVSQTLNMWKIFRVLVFIVQIKDIVQPKTRGVIEGYHSNRFDFLYHRRYFFDTHKGLISQRKLQKNQKLLLVEVGGINSYTVLGVARQAIRRNVRYRHRSCVDTWSYSTNMKKYF